MAVMHYVTMDIKWVLVLSTLVQHRFAYELMDQKRMTSNGQFCLV